MAFGIASKTIVDSKGPATLLIVGVRGSNYQSEWASNMNVGTGGDHYGFSSAAKQVIGGLRNYITKHGLTGTRVKLWISGFSRAAATSNLTAGYLDMWIDDPVAYAAYDIDASLAKEDIYAYTFETPSGTIEPNCASARFGNIFNFVNPNDIVPKVAPYLSGNDDFRRFGVDRFFPSSISNAANQAYQTKMLSLLNPMYTQRGKTYDIDKFRVKAFSLGSFNFIDAPVGQHSAAAFANDFLNDLIQNGVHTRAEYVSTYQQPLMTLMGFLCGCAKYGTAAQTTAFMNHLKTPSNYIPALIRIVIAALNATQTVDESIAAIVKISTNLLKSARNASGMTTTQMPDSELESVGAAIGKVLRGLMTEAERMEIVKTVDLVVTLYLNVSYILQAHDSDLCYAWLMTMDPNFTNSPLDWQQVFQCGEYRLVMVWGKAKITVQQLTAGGGVQASMTVDENGTITGDATLGDATFGIRPTPTLHNLNYFYLPSNGHYRLQITNLDENEYSVSEYNPKVGDVKRMFVYTKDVPTGDYVADFPAYTAEEQRTGLPDGSSYSYALQKGKTYVNGGKTIALPSKDMRLTELRQNYVFLNVDSSDDMLGTAIGSGVYRKYSAVRLQAQESEHGVFVGWRTPDQIIALTEREVYVSAGLNKQTYTAVFAYKDAPKSVRAAQAGMDASQPQVMVTWDAPAGESDPWVQGFRVYRRAHGGTDYLLLGTTNATATDWLDTTSLVPGTTYDYAVTTIARDPSAASSNTFESQKVESSVTLGNPWELTSGSVKVRGYSLGASPSALSATVCGQSDARNSHMRIYTGEQFINSFALTLADNQAYVQGGMTVTLPVQTADGTVLRIQQDTDAAGIGSVTEDTAIVENSRVTLVTPDVSLGQFFLTTLQKPGSPENLTAVNSAQQADVYEVTVTWDDPSLPCLMDGYIVYRSDKAAPVTIVAADTHSFVDATVLQGATYTYRVCAFNDAGQGDPAQAAVQVGNHWVLSATDEHTDDTATVEGYSLGSEPVGLTLTTCAETDPKNGQFIRNSGESYLGSWSLAFTGTEGNVADGYTVTLPVPSVCDGTRVHVQQDVGDGSPVKHVTAEAENGAITFRTKAKALGQFYTAELTEKTAPQALQGAVSSTLLAEHPQFTLTWRAPSDFAPVTQYRIYRDGKRIGVLPSDRTTFVDNDPSLISATLYTYTIVAYNGQFCGAPAECGVSSVRRWTLKQHGVIVTGFSDRHAPTSLTAEQLTESDERLRHMPTGTQAALAQFDLSLSQGWPVSILDGTKLTVSLPVPISANGTVTVMRHDRDAYGTGDVESFIVQARDGFSTAEVEGLSPFRVSGEAKKPPVTGDDTPIALWVYMALASLAAATWLVLRRRWRHRDIL